MAEKNRQFRSTLPRNEETRGAGGKRRPGEKLYSRAAAAAVSGAKVTLYSVSVLKPK